MHGQQQQQQQQRQQQQQQQQHRFIWDSVLCRELEKRAASMRVGTQSWEKSELASVAGQNYHLCKAGAYTDSHGRLHDLRIARSFSNRTIVVPPNGQGTPPATPLSSATRLCVVRMDTASAARALAERGIEAACLNFANQYHTGGGYLSGARAQEEDLCRLMPQLYSQLSKLPYPIRDDAAHWTRTWLARTSGESML